MIYFYVTSCGISAHRLLCHSLVLSGILIDFLEPALGMEDQSNQK